jgi:hypothetical protein
MKYRKKVKNKEKDKKVFSRTADRTRKENVDDRPKRGGIRL